MIREREVAALALCLALAGCGDAAAKGGLHLVDGGATWPRTALTITMTPERPASLYDRAGVRVAWRERDGSVHVAPGVTAEQVAALVFEIGDHMARVNEEAAEMLRKARGR